MNVPSEFELPLPLPLKPPNNDPMLPNPNDPLLEPLLIPLLMPLLKPLAPFALPIPKLPSLLENEFKPEPEPEKEVAEKAVPDPGVMLLDEVGPDKEPN